MKIAQRTLEILFLTAVVAALPLGWSAPARALERSAYSMEILVDGVPLREHAARGKRYVEALEGREYAIRLGNHTRERIAVALSVDGLNSIDAKTTPAGEASKWILGPHESVTLDGWQVSSDKARQFFFTTEEQSYGAWLGRTRNLGLISAAVFRERRPVPAPIHTPRLDRDDASARPADEPSPSAPGRSEGKAAGDARARMEMEQPRERHERKRKLSDDLAATGIGRKIDHRVRRVSFEAQASPSATLEIRYEYHDALVRLGVLDDLERPLARRERSRGFADSGFAPDPFRP